jgi:hypothetical protein
MHASRHGRRVAVTATTVPLLQVASVLQYVPYKLRAVDLMTVLDVSPFSCRSCRVQL